MKKSLIWVIILIVLALDWVALDDITTGNESSYFLEYMVLVISLLFFILLLLFRKKIKNG